MPINLNSLTKVFKAVNDTYNSIKKKHEKHDKEAIKKLESEIKDLMAFILSAKENVAESINHKIDELAKNWKKATYSKDIVKLGKNILSKIEFTLHKKTRKAPSKPEPKKVIKKPIKKSAAAVAKKTAPPKKAGAPKSKKK